MKSILFSLGCLLGVGTPTPATAQQVICQRTFSAVAASGSLTTVLTGNVTAVNADSALLLVNTSPSGFASGQPRRAALVWVERGQCDTLPLQTVGVGNSSYYGHSLAYALTTRRKYLRVVTTRLTSNSTLQLWEFSRRGQLRGQYSYPFATDNIARGLVEAPDQGTYLSVGNFSGAGIPTKLVKVNDQGQMQWQRTYSSRSNSLGTKSFEFNRPCYTVRGNLLLAGNVIYVKAGGGEQYGQVVEVNQQGDSLTSRILFRGQNSKETTIEEIQPLHDGGFLLLTRLDTATTTSSISFRGITRLDANLNEVWTRFSRPVGKTMISSQGGEGSGLELADGTLIVTVSLGNATTNAYLDTHLLRVSASGQILQEYAVPASTLSVQSVAPMASDSSLILNGQTTNGGTVLQLRLPGLRRVVAAPAIPAAQPLATRAATAAWPAPAYPNPATASVTVPLPALVAEAQLTLRDLLGRQVRTQTVAAGTGAATVAVAGLAPGVYVLTLERAGQAPAMQRLTVAGP